MKVIYILFAFLLVACESDVKESEHGSSFYDLRVENLSDVEIYPVIISAETEVRESFGVVGIKKSATTGFGPMRMEHKMIVAWEEGGSDVDYVVELNASELLPLSLDVKRISFLYKGDKEWYIQLQDGESKVIGMSEKGSLIEYKNSDGSDVVDFSPYVEK
jgi:hypothetical protein